MINILEYGAVGMMPLSFRKQSIRVQNREEA